MQRAAFSPLRAAAAALPRCRRAAPSPSSSSCSFSSSSSSPAYDFVIAGAGVTALASARYLARAAPSARILLVTPHAPMSQTSSLSTECYRDHWPSAGMRAFMQRSIALIDAHAAEQDAFRVTRHGYLYCSKEAAAPAAFAAEARECHGASEVRVMRSAAEAAALGRAPWSSRVPRAMGADVFTTAGAALAAFPYLSGELSAAMHTRNCGWVSAQTMGMDMLDALLARRGADGAPLTTLARGRVVGADLAPGAHSIAAVHVEALADPDAAAAAAAAAPRRRTVTCGAFVNAAGPFLKQTHAAVLGAAGAAAPGGAAASDLPVSCEVHAKVVFRDVLNVIPRDAPQAILIDRAAPRWLPEELEHVAETVSREAADRAQSLMGGGAHFRPYGGEESNAVLMLWEAWHHGVEPSEPPPEAADQYLDRAMYPDVALRGLAQLVPGLAAYFDEGERAALARARGGGAELPEAKEPYVDGGYYTKTLENHPLVGPMPGPGGKGRLDNGFVCGAVSGYGIMASHAAGELCAAHAVGASLPSYAELMSPLRYQSDAFMKKGGVRDQLLAAGGGQL